MNALFMYINRQGKMEEPIERFFFPIVAISDTKQKDSPCVLLTITEDNKNSNVCVDLHIEVSEARTIAKLLNMAADDAEKINKEVNRNDVERCDIVDMLLAADRAACDMQLQTFYKTNFHECIQKAIKYLPVHDERKEDEE